MQNITVRPYDKEKDKNAVHRIWKEVGWLEKGKEKVMDTFLSACEATVAEINENAEFLVLTSSGTIQYQEEKLPFSGVMGVTTSRIARKRGLATKITAEAIAKSAENGSVLSGLGIFEQGFYNKLGYGSGGYEHIVSFDPAELKITSSFRIPKRLTLKDWKLIHKSRLERKTSHGQVNFFDPKITKAEMEWVHNGFGLGYFDETGKKLTHHIWFSARNNETGPFWISWMSYQNREQFLELLALIKSFNDQVRLISMVEPPFIQMQDFLKQPFRFQQITEKSKFENRIKALSYWQVRICNLEYCLEKTQLNCPDYEFNLQLTDPIEKYIDNKFSWKGISGNYIIHLGKKSFAEKGFNKKLPVLKTSVGAFTRMWLGILPATALSFSDEFATSEKLLKFLDKAFLLPVPKTNWSF